MNAEYERLPEGVKLAVPWREWRWLSDREKQDIVQNETEPEEA
jgi:hypothetical protein